MKDALRDLVSAAIAFILAKWLVDEGVAQYQMWATDIWGEGYLSACESIRDGSINSPKYAYLGENGERVVVSAERLKELEALEVMHAEYDAKEQSKVSV